MKKIDNSIYNLINLADAFKSKIELTKVSNYERYKYYNLLNNKDNHYTNLQTIISKIKYMEH